MRDKISEERIAFLHPYRREEVTEIINTVEGKFPVNMAIRIAQGLRTFAEQDALYKQRPKITNAKGGQSLHNYGLAIDFAILHDKDSNGNYEELSWNVAADFDKDGIIDWQEVVTEFTKKGWEWGGSWRTFVDLPHCQKTGGFGWRQLLDKYNKNDFIPGTIYVKI